ncbi:MAG: ABC transporter ATP-binding protein [Dongiaceae bacterium]
MNAPALEIRGLSVAYPGEAGPIHALSGIDLAIEPGEVVGLVGESGSGKSTLAHAILRLLPGSARIAAERLSLAGVDMLAASESQLQRHRGRLAAMVFQDPMTTFSPVVPIGEQLADFLDREPGLGRAARRARIAEMLGRVGIPDPARRLAAYPHELSGGMLQRVSIAAALMMRPALLIADEPTTALDVTMEAQILHLMRRLKEEITSAILIVSHQLGVIAELCDRVAVMYAGEIVESGLVTDIFARPAHPYTRSLLACDPALIPGEATRLPVIGGEVPDLSRSHRGCAFAPRCREAEPGCSTRPPPRRRGPDEHGWRCVHGAPGEIAAPA